MNKQEQVKLEDLPENCQVIEIPDYVYVSSTGKYYYLEPTTKAKVKMSLEKAEEKGLKPSRIYSKFLEKIAKEEEVKNVK